MRLILMGAPGSGKGTQADVIGQRLNVPAISTGDIFRANVSAGTTLGVIAKRHMDAGEYVPDEVTNSMVRDRIKLADCEPGFLLDGYPRTLAQVFELDDMLHGQDHRLDCVVVLEVDPDELVERLVRRAILEGRADDTPDVIRRRQEIYAEQTAPLVEHYANRGLVVSIDAAGPVDDVTRRILDALDSVGVAGVRQA